jgi:hypothetical protein
MNPVQPRSMPMQVFASLVLPIALILAACGDEVKLERRSVTYPNGKSVKED